MTEFRSNPLPAVYKQVELSHSMPTPNMADAQAVYLAAWFWLIMGVFSNQGTTFSTGGAASLITTLVVNFPGHSLVKYILVFGWLQVADIIKNPFGYDQYYDTQLSDVLDVEIWKASVTIESQQSSFPS